MSHSKDQIASEWLSFLLLNIRWVICIYPKMQQIDLPFEMFKCNKPGKQYRASSRQLIGVECHLLANYIFSYIDSKLKYSIYICIYMYSIYYPLSPCYIIYQDLFLTLQAQYLYAKCNYQYHRCFIHLLKINNIVRITYFGFSQWASNGFLRACQTIVQLMLDFSRIISEYQNSEC